MLKGTNQQTKMAQNKLPTHSKGVSNDEYDNQLRDIIKFYIQQFECRVNHTETTDIPEQNTTSSKRFSLTKDTVCLFKNNIDDITEITIDSVLALSFTTYPQIR